MNITITLTSDQINRIKDGESIIYAIYAELQSGSSTVYNVHASCTEAVTDDAIVGTTT